MKRVMDMTENLVRIVAFMAGLSAADALEEAGRCLRCDIKDQH